DAAVVGRQLEQAASLAAGRHVYGGLGIYRLGGRGAELRAMVERARALQLQGLVLFSYNYLQQDPQVAELWRTELFRGRARVPAMPWKPPAPRASHGAGGRVSASETGT